MKPCKTWIVLADATAMRVVGNDGPGKGLYAVRTPGLEAPEVSALSDAPGTTHAPVGPNRGGITEPDLKGQAMGGFAADIVKFLAEKRAQGSFDRLILIAAPAMLGVLRQKLTAPLQAVLHADLAKDLTHTPLDTLPRHLDDILVV